MSVIIPRSVWKPRHDNGFAIIGVGEWLAAGKEIWVHHSVTNPPGPDATLEEDCAHMREFEQIGESRFGGGISYTWVIMPSGRVFQGHDIDRQGSHTYQRNNRSRAICFAGKYHINTLPDRMANAAAALLRELGATANGPHSAVYATDCPGDYVRARLNYINELASSGRPIDGGDDDMANLDDMQVDVSGSPDGTYRETASIALGAAAGNSRTAVAKLDEVLGKIDSGGMTEAQLDIVAAKVAAKLGDTFADAVADRLAARLQD
jgi:hypothetical protein